MLEGQKLLKKWQNSIIRIEFTNGAIYTMRDCLLTLPNEEKYKGILSCDEGKKNYGLTKGEYFWPNKQKNFGAFDEQNRFSTNEGELSKLTFSNGDIFRGEFKEGKITEGKEITANFAGGKVNGLIDYKDTKKGVTFQGYLCTTEVN